jgi:hypothetical protein
MNKRLATEQMTECGFRPSRRSDGADFYKTKPSSTDANTTVRLRSHVELFDSLDRPREQAQALRHRP